MSKGMYFMCFFEACIMDGMDTCLRHVLEALFGTWLHMVSCLGDIDTCLRHILGTLCMVVMVHC
jgi:hypothetical protein